MSLRSLRAAWALATALALLTLGGGASRLDAQALQVRAVEQASGGPLAGALVDVLDPQDRVVVQGVLGADGRRLLPLPAGGTYRVRVRRIGYQPYLSAPVLVVGRATVPVSAEVPARRVVLAEVRVTAARRCARDAFGDAGFATLWEEVRTALTSTVLSRDDRTLTLEARSFRRRLDPDRTVQEELVGLPRTTDAARPYVALPAADLSERGYVQFDDDGATFHAPDEVVLLSDQFLHDHCFEVVRGGDRDGDGLYGVRFTPAPRRRVNDIAGTLWVDSATAELRYLDFWYAHDSLPRPVIGEGRSGGQVVFERLPTGQWIIGAWRLRMPYFGARRQLRQSSAADGYEEYGGVVTPVDGSRTAPLRVLHPYRELLVGARVTGTVYDSLAGRPLADARVWLRPIEPPDVVAQGLGGGPAPLAAEPVVRMTDSTGSYVLDDVPPGTWRLAVEHPRLDSLGVVPARFDIRLKPGALVAGDLTVPSLATLATGCVRHQGAPMGLSIGNVVLGTVRSAADGRPLVDALVRVRWTDLNRFAQVSRNALEPASEVIRSSTELVAEVRTDSLGMYRVCSVPDSTIVTVQAAGPSSRTGEVDTQIGAYGVAAVNLRLAEVDSGEAAPRPGTLLGTVADTSGRPLREALVTLDGVTAEARTDSAGRFALRDVAAGTQTVEVRLVGLAPARTTVDVVPGDTARVTLVLTRSVELDTVRIVAAARASSPRAARVVEAIARHEVGTGNLFLAEEIDRHASMATLVGMVPRVRIVGNNGRWTAMMPAAFGGQCEARVFIDGRESDYDEVIGIGLPNMAAVEVFVSAAFAPDFTKGHSRFGREGTCGVLIFWTK